MKFINKKIVLILILTSFVFPLTAENNGRERIICWGGGYSLVLDMLYMFPEAENSLIAMGRNSQAGGYFQELLDADFEKKAVLDMQLQPETAATYNPTHIILKNYMRRAAGSLEKLGIPVMFIDMESPEQYDNDLDRIGKLFKNEERASELKHYFNSEREEVTELTERLPESEKPRVLFMYYSTKGGSAALQVPPSGWIQTRMIEWAGGIPVWKNAVSGNSWQVVSFEQIGAWNPDIIFLVTYHTDVEPVRDQLKNDRLWSMLKAVKNNELYAFPGDYLSWDQPDPRWILGLNWLGTRLHPEVFSGERMDQKLYDFFSTAYGFSRTQVDKNIIPRITGDYR